jgi:hypothetical protein
MAAGCPPDPAIPLPSSPRHASAPPNSSSCLISSRALAAGEAGAGVSPTAPKDNLDHASPSRCGRFPFCTASRKRWRGCKLDCSSVICLRRCRERRGYMCSSSSCNKSLQRRPNQAGRIIPRQDKAAFPVRKEAVFGFSFSGGRRAMDRCNIQSVKYAYGKCLAIARCSSPMSTGTRTRYHRNHYIKNSNM